MSCLRFVVNGPASPRPQVPPMSPEATRAAIARELGLAEGQLGAVFEWINLERPLGSASISQVPCVQGLRLGEGQAPYLLSRRPLNSASRL